MLQITSDSWQKRLRQLAPGIGLTVLIGAFAWVLQATEQQIIGQPVIEVLVIAVLLGMIWRNAFDMRPRYLPGVSFVSREVLETAIVLLGATIDLPTLLRAGPLLLVTIVAVVVIGLTASVTIGQAIGLNPKLAILIAVGNAICGNSAIAAVAPIIKADAEDVASAVALTASLGVAVILVLPLLIPIFQFSSYQYGVLAGMTVYALPQVIAATFPVSQLSGQIGTVVKLVRVLMLGPVVLYFSLRNGDRLKLPEQPHLRLTSLVPWFIIGFVILAALRSVGLIPAGAGDYFKEISRLLSIAAMAALGLGVDFDAVQKVGRPVALAVMGSLLMLIAVGIVLIRLIGIQG